MNLYHHPDHAWYFASDQMRDEVWMLKCFDSKDGVAKGSWPSLTPNDNI